MLKLNRVIHWIANHGVAAYDRIQISKELDIDTSLLPMSWVTAVEIVLTESLSNTLQTLNISTPDTTDELFDCLLTLFESLNEFKDDFKSIFSPHTMGLSHLKLLPVFQDISQSIFHSDINTFLDRTTYSLILIKLFHTWLQDNTDDLALTSHAINQLCCAVFEAN